MSNTAGVYLVMVAVDNKLHRGSRLAEGILEPLMQRSVLQNRDWVSVAIVVVIVHVLDSHARLGRHLLLNILQARRASTMGITAIPRA